MLTARFERIGGWQDATHGDWLAIDEMELLWRDGGNDERIAAIVNNIGSAMGNWANDAGSLFRQDRLTVFAASRDTFERIYLVWFDEVVEPELWVYDSNGESRYKNLLDYLIAYIDDDLSASTKRWRLGDL
ncbi:hypothetical protein EGT74_06370 [Chitinophaga lutea]|uniref:SMI1/KNR4 family protein n=2 Tax=Chitinophaga lutea TaxID=2488634 RepID=A0A3N4QEG8_9BACT|nr:hypothetical protein EGT74_06370 [Chitinophaga lutea]